MGEEFEASEPSGTSYIPSYSSASSDSTTPLSPDHPLTQASPTPTPTRVLLHCRIARIAVRTQPTLSSGMSARIAEEAALSSSYFRKRYRGTFELILDTNDESSDSDDEGHGLDDKGHGLDDEGHGLEDEGPGLEEEETAPEVSSPIASHATTPPATISVDEDQFLERYRFKSLEREQERATMTFSAIWRPILALEAWAGQTDAQREALWHAIYVFRGKPMILRGRLLRRGVSDWS
nr:hypothetical protein [Tanacetum cinerariifolium]